MNCNLCPRKCNTDRSVKIGACGTGETLRVARAALHFWEEPCISGEEGSGAVFFSGCTLGCVYCQNGEISRGKSGIEITPNRLTEIFFELKARGANNINLVTPDHYAEKVADAVSAAKQAGLERPIIVNTGGYLSDEILDLLLPVTDIWLTDFKYMSADLALRYSRARDYPEVAAGALDRIVSAVGVPKYDRRGMMTKGVIVRHLMLPGCLDDSKSVVRYLYGKYGDGIVLSLMNQYTPPEYLKDIYPEIAMAVPEDDYEALIDYALDLGVENAYIQEGGTVSESFIPAFDGTGVLR